MDGLRAIEMQHTPRQHRLPPFGDHLRDGHRRRFLQTCSKACRSTEAEGQDRTEIARKSAFQSLPLWTGAAHLVRVVQKGARECSMSERILRFPAVKSLS